MALRQGMFDLGQGFIGRRGQVLVAGRLDQPCAQREGIKLFEREGERWQVKAGSQHIAHASLAIDGRSGSDQMGYVTIDRSLGDFETMSHIMGGDSAGRGFPQGLDNPDQTFGAAH